MAVLSQRGKQGGEAGRTLEHAAQACISPWTYTGWTHTEDTVSTDPMTRRGQAPPAATVVSGFKLFSKFTAGVT